MHQNTVEPPNKGQVRDNTIQLLPLVERLSSFRGFQYNRESDLGIISNILGREVYYTVSLSWRVHYRMFHCESRYQLESTFKLSTICMYNIMEIQKKQK